MSLEIVLGIVVVVLAWGLAAVAIRRWGPGHASRRVRCPNDGSRASVLVEFREADFGSVRAADIVRCSLAPGAEPACGKECLARL